MHRRLLSVALAASLVVSATSARADGYETAPAYAPPPQEVLLPVSPWTGLYLNGGVGYGFWQADTTTANPITGACVLCAKQQQGGNGWLGEIGLGYDYQFTPRIVAGVFFNYDFSALEGTIQDQRRFLAGQTELDSSWFVGGRAGWLMTPDILNYFTVGYTEAHFQGASMSNTGLVAVPPTGSGYATSAYDAGGWFIGGGLEVSVGGGWFWRSEYRYSQYGQQALTDTSAVAPRLDNINFEPDVQTATSEVVYKFNWFGH